MCVRVHALGAFSLAVCVRLGVFARYAIRISDPICACGTARFRTASVDLQMSFYLSKLCDFERAK